MSNIITHIRCKKEVAEILKVIALKVSAELEQTKSTGDILDGLINSIEPDRNQQATTISRRISDHLTGSD